MRRILISYARQAGALKRGKDARGLSLDEVCELAQEKAGELIALDDALLSLERIDPEKCRIVVLRSFGGLTVEETALVLNLSVSTVVRHWRAARAWLYHALSKELTQGNESLAEG